MDFFGHFHGLLGHFSGGSTWHFSDFEVHLWGFGVLRFRGSVGGPSDCKCWVTLTVVAAHSVSGNYPLLLCCSCPWLRGPAAILFTSRDTFSVRIAKLYCACVCGGIAYLSRDTLQNGVSHRCACVKLSTKGGVSHHFGEAANLP